MWLCSGIQALCTQKELLPDVFWFKGRFNVVMYILSNGLTGLLIDVVRAYSICYEQALHEGSGIFVSLFGTHSINFLFALECSKLAVNLNLARLSPGATHATICKIGDCVV
jgi:hypothetical protein